MWQDDRCRRHSSSSGRRQQKQQHHHAPSKALRDNNILHDQNLHLTQRLGEKTGTIAHSGIKMRDLTASTSQQLESMRAEAQESDQLKDALLAVGTAAIADLRIKLEAGKGEKKNLTGLLRDREKRLVELQDAWMEGAPVQTRIVVEAFSERSLSLVRNLKADLAAAETANQRLRAEGKTGMEVLRKRNSELRAKSERDDVSLQELRLGMVEGQRRVRVAEEGRDAADERARVARCIAEEQERVIERLLRENERGLNEFRRY